MQTAMLTRLSCSLVPHSTRPFWHEWGGQQQEEPKGKENTKTARRRLFQEEPNGETEQNKQFVHRLLEEIAERYKQKWHFDFDKGQPVEGGGGQFHYESVPAQQVPGFYRASRLFGQQNANAVPKQMEMEAEEELNENEPAWAAGKSAGEAQAEMAMESTKSPSRALRKARPSANRTPKRGGGSMEAVGWIAGEGQSKMTDFLNARKGLARSATKKEGAAASVDSPSKRRRHSLVDSTKMVPPPMVAPSPIKKAGRRSQRIHHARLALFK